MITRSMTMPTALQLTGNNESDRSEAIAALQTVADKYGLSYGLDTDAMTIALPKFDEEALPVVGTVPVPEEEA
jgi:hypothetical protein